MRTARGLLGAGVGAVLLLLTVWRGTAQQDHPAAMPQNVPRTWQTTVRDKVYTAYAEHFPGRDWGEKINNAIDAVRSGRDGGEIILPPTRLEIATPIDLRGTRKRHPKGAALGIVLRGAAGAYPTELVWTGKPRQAMIDMSGAGHSQVRSLWINGNGVEGVIGLRYGGGWDRFYNGGKMDLVEDLHVLKCDVGLEIGDLYGPDIVATSFRNLWIWQVRIGVRVMGANVAMMQFSNIALTHYREAGLQLHGHAGRVVRSRSEAGQPTDENVLREPDGLEVFLEDLPPYVVQSGRLQPAPPPLPGKKSYPSVGGGFPELVIYGLTAHSDRKEAWLIDTNWAPARVYSARIEGPGGVLRFRTPMGGMRHNVVLVDVSATSRGEGAGGNVIEFHGHGPLYLVGCALNGNVAIGHTQVFSTGTFFMKTKAGFVSLPETRGAVVHESHAMHQQSVSVPANAQSVHVALEGTGRQRDGRYQVAVTPGWNAGGCWVSGKEPNGFTVHFERAPSQPSPVDVVVTRAPFRNVQTSY